MSFENFDEAVLANEKLKNSRKNTMFPSLEIPEEAVSATPIMPRDISLDTVYVVDGKTFTDKTEAAYYQQQRQREVAEVIVKQLPQSHDNQTIFYEIWDQYKGKKHCHERHTNAEKAYNRMGKVTNYFPDRLWIDQVTITENADGTVDLDRQLVYRHKF